MTKVSAKKTAKKVTKKVDAKTETKFNAVEFARKGTLAYFGLYGYAYDRAKLRFEQARTFATTSTNGLFDELVEKGEGVEAQASALFKGAQLQAAKTYSENADKVKAALPKFANDRVSELEAEVDALNKKITALSKKAKTVRKPVSAKMKTEKATADISTPAAEETTATKAA